MFKRRIHRGFKKKPLVKWHTTLLSWSSSPAAVVPNTVSVIELLTTAERGATQALSVLPDNQVECRVNCIRGTLYFENDSTTISHTIFWGVQVVDLTNNAVPASPPDPVLIPNVPKSWLWLEMIRLSPNSAAGAAHRLELRDVNIRSKRVLKPGQTLLFTWNDIPDNGTDNSVVLGLNVRTLLTRLD